ncbi:hypothetical protein HCN44_007021 [Aphidius gifuensis]|uniref:tRNA-splicing endonuclease subunit Sen54 N-terminal domain-containing protein n=1 Tax=Aphidius gifuensis TaxID=684658 RepID=A0A835CUA3_APHGI|nr:putative uncharacterized protein DDB_G0277255 [Aphidius gifuensis]KAF7995914.1 hypothetical protein HCN44_007021 [Aphidius gifuensis]
MAEETDRKQLKLLTASELLKTRGIQAEASHDFDRSSYVIPKSGYKLSNPSGSLLENQQIDTNLNSRKNLIKCERVTRLSQLACADWLQYERKAKITKITGCCQNYGTTVNGTIYLLPEEALLLLETNQLELKWNKLPLSIQQAYEVILDSSKTGCSLDKYRVFSHLTRIGYHLQRFNYDYNLLNDKHDDQHKKKVIVNPENGNWISKNDKTIIDNSLLNIDKVIIDVVDDIISNIEKNEDDKVIKSKKKVEIICEEKLSQPIEFVKSSTVIDSDINNTPKWTSARIKRNIKLLPKTIDNKSNELTDKRKTNDPLEISNSKKSKHEVIDLSDDEIQEIPRKLTRIEMLNFLPNFSSDDSKIEKIPPRIYIPSGIEPQKTIYDALNFKKLKNSKREHSSSSMNNNANNNNTTGTPVCQRDPNVNNFNDSSRNQYRNNHFPSGYNNYYNSGVNNAQLMNINYQQYRMQQNFSIAPRFNYLANRWSSHYHMNIVRTSMTMGVTMMGGPMNFHNNMLNNAQQMYRPPRGTCDFGLTIPRQMPSTSRSTSLPTPSSSYRNHHKQTNKEIAKSDQSNIKQSAFANIPAKSWSELKEKMTESKTITIDDDDEDNDDDDDKMDCSDIEVVGQNIGPLINVNNCKNFADVYDKLQIIKSAHEKTVRRKKCDYEISYKVYGYSQVFRKSDPGVPIFHLVITRDKNKFLQPVELNRIQREDKNIPVLIAVVSSYAITYIQIGVIQLPSQIIE